MQFHIIEAGEGDKCGIVLECIEKPDELNPRKLYIHHSSITRKTLTSTYQQNKRFFQDLPSIMITGNDIRTVALRPDPTMLPVTNMLAGFYMGDGYQQYG